MKKEKTNWKMKLILVFGILLFFNFVSAQVIGGEILIGSDVNPNWQNVFVYNVNDVNDYFESFVSPTDYRYSFENSEVFEKDDLIRAEILDFENGFMAGPVDMNLSFDNDRYYSCEDCDIFSPMEFREVVQVSEPSKKLIISEGREFDISFNLYDDCDLYFDETKLCEAGCDFHDLFKGKIGLNN
ncbi:MAG: hypothetical protein P8X70_03470, partial [Nanoarchaeota archaeon]